MISKSVMKIKKDLELNKQYLDERKPFKIIYDGNDFGIFYYNSIKKRYDGKYGNINIKSMLTAIADDKYFIQAIVMMEEGI